jgi:folylpolyglutamate synthase/dihydropteroate synthase
MMRSVKTAVLPDPAAADTNRVLSFVSMAFCCAVVHSRPIDIPPSVFLRRAANGIKGAVESLKTYFPDKKIIFIVGAMADKDVSGMMQLLTPIADVFFTARPDNDRAMSSYDLCKLLQGLGAKAFSNKTVFDAVKSALDGTFRDGKTQSAILRAAAILSPEIFTQLK